MCGSIESVNTNRATLIERWAFYNCPNLKNVTIGVADTEPEVTILSETFTSCKNLRDVTLGKNVKSIGERTFADCTSLEKLICYAENPPQIESNTFEGVSSGWVTLYVPVGSKSKYQADPNWSIFTDIVEGFENAGVDDIEIDINNEPEEYYNLQGIKVNEPTDGIYIRRKGKTISKVIL